MGRMSRLVRRTFCRCSSAGLVVRVVTMQILVFSFFPFFFCFTYDGYVFLLCSLAVLLISLLATVGREET